MLFLFFTAWSVILYNIAQFLIKDCNHRPILNLHKLYPSLIVLVKTRIQKENKELNLLIFYTKGFLYNHLDPRSWSRTTGNNCKYCVMLNQPCHIYLFKKTFHFITACWWMFAARKITAFIPAYFIFFSALWITVYTDLTHMLISRFVSLYLAPIGIIFACTNLLPLHPVESIIAVCFGYVLLWIANKLFFIYKGHDGLGQGDLELIACIGAFTGILGCWCTLLFGSLAGTIIGCLYMLLHKKSVKILPFGPFLAFGASTFVVYQTEILTYLSQNT